MERLKQLIERDQWAELLIDTQNRQQFSKNSEIEVLAFSEKEALKKACEIFKVTSAMLQVETLRKKKTYFLGLLKDPAHYLCSIKDEYKDVISDESIYYDQYNELSKNQDGSFLLQMRKKGLWLKITEPKGIGLSVSLADIIKEIKNRHIEHYNEERIKHVLHSMQPNYIGPYVQSEHDSTCSITIEKNDMKAQLIITRPLFNGRVPDIKEVVRLLNKNHVIYGIREEFIQEAIENELFDIPVVVALGTPAENGQNAYIEYLFPTSSNTEHKHTIRSDGSIDFKELNTIHNVKENTVLAVMHPHTAGKIGTTVTGNSIPASDGSPINWTLGTNVRISNDGLQVLANTFGQAFLSKDSEICVDPILDIATDVDLSVGNIDFIGNVIIRGGISDGFSVVSSGNVEVHGHIGKCHIQAKGNIISHQGIQGKDEAHIQCDGDLYARFVERSIITVGGNIIINKSLLHSKVYCDKGIYVIGDPKRSIIAGGVIRAQEEIVATQIGAESYIDTSVEAGYSRKFVEAIQQEQRAIKTINQKISQIREASFGNSNPSSDQVIQITQEISKLSQQIERREHAISIAQKSLSQIQQRGCISALNAFMPGVKVHFGVNHLDVLLTQESCSFQTEQKEIVCKPLHVSSFAQEIIQQQNATQKNKKKGSK